MTRSSEEKSKTNLNTSDFKKISTQDYTSNKNESGFEKPFKPPSIESPPRETKSLKPPSIESPPRETKSSKSPTRDSPPKDIKPSKNPKSENYNFKGNVFEKLLKEEKAKKLEEKNAKKLMTIDKSIPKEKIAGKSKNSDTVNESQKERIKKEKVQNGEVYKIRIKNARSKIKKKEKGKDNTGK